MCARLGEVYNVRWQKAFTAKRDAETAEKLMSLRGLCVLRGEKLWTANGDRVGNSSGIYPVDAPGRPASTTRDPPVRSVPSGTVTRSRTLKSARIVVGVTVQAT